MSDADERMRKAELAVEIANVIESKRLTQVEAARLLGVDQPKVSSLVRGRLEGFSIGRLLLFLNRLGRDVTIEVREAPRRRAGETRVRVA
jgi:predicted XRE-type DNA-binding protein